MRFEKLMALGVVAAGLAVSGATYACSIDGYGNIGRGDGSSAAVVQRQDGLWTNFISHRGVTRIAQATHADICKANLDQCETACDGFAQCIKQCEVNYQGCMAQGG